MMDYRSELRTYLNRRVCIELHRRCAVWGTLEKVGDESLKLANSVMLRDPENEGWFEQVRRANEEVVAGPHYAETVVRFDDILAVTCVDDDFSDDDSADTNVPANTLGLNRIQQLRSNATLSTALSRLATGLKISTPGSEEPTVPLFDRIGLEIGLRLIRLTDSAFGGDLIDRIGRVRQSIVQEKGFTLPKLRIRDNIEIDPQAYRILIDGHAVANGKVHDDRLLAIDSCDSGVTLTGIKTADPVFGQNAWWIEPSQRDHAELLGFRTVEPTVVITTHLTDVAKRNLHRLFECEDVKRIVERMTETAPTVVAELIPHMMSYSTLHRFFCLLLEESVSMRNERRIFESLAFHSQETSCLLTLLERVRVDLAYDICGPLADADQQIYALPVDMEIEEELLQHLAIGGELSASPHFEQIADELQQFEHSQIVVVNSTKLRRPLFAALVRRFCRVTVLARNEIPAEYTTSSENVFPF